MTFIDLPSAEKFSFESDKDYINRMKKRYLEDFEKIGNKQFMKQAIYLPMYSKNYDKDDNLDAKEKNPIMTHNKFTWYVPYMLYDDDDYKGMKNGRYFYDWEANKQAKTKYQESCLRCDAMKKAINSINQSGKTDKYLYFNDNSHYVPILYADVVNCGTEVKDDYWSLFKLKINQGIGKVKRLGGLTNFHNKK